MSDPILRVVLVTKTPQGGGAERIAMSLHRGLLDRAGAAAQIS